MSLAERLEKCIELNRLAEQQRRRGMPPDMFEALASYVDAARACDAALPQLVKFFDDLPPEKQDELKSRLFSETDLSAPHNLGEVFNLDMVDALIVVWHFVRNFDDTTMEDEPHPDRKRKRP